MELVARRGGVRRAVTYHFSAETRTLQEISFVDVFARDRVTEELQRKLRNAVATWGDPDSFFAEARGRSERFGAVWVVSEKERRSISYRPRKLWGDDEFIEIRTSYFLSGLEKSNRLRTPALFDLADERESFREALRRGFRFDESEG